MRMRPRFEVRTPMASQQVLARLGASLADPASPIRGTIAGKHALLHMRDDLRHTWSPYLDLGVERSADGTLLRGCFGPHPTIWTFFAALYAVCAFVALGGFVVGLSQLSLGFTAWGLWAVPAAAVVAGITYGVALMGQGLAHEQMHQLRTFLDQTLDLAAAPPAA